MTKFEYSAGAFVYRMENEKPIFLLLKKPNKEYDVPKGHIEKGETPEIGAKREIMEESGIAAQFIPNFSVITKYFFRRGKERIAKQVKYFLCEVKSAEVKISSEHIGYEWVTYEEARKKFRFEDLVKLLDTAYEYIGRYKKIAEINRRYARLPEGRDWRLSRNFVPGEGRLDSGVMVIGQAPGADEDVLRRPFIGRSGRLLDEMFKSARIDRKKLYITSTVQFFPPANRLPEKDEIELCLPFLHEQMDVIKPRCIMLLGNVSTLAVLGVVGAETNHGMVVKKDGITYMITLHPAAILRFKSKSGMMLGDFKKFRQLIDKKDDSA